MEQPRVGAAGGRGQGGQGGGVYCSCWMWIWHWVSTANIAVPSSSSKEERHGDDLRDIQQQLLHVTRESKRLPRGLRALHCNNAGELPESDKEGQGATRCQSACRALGVLALPLGHLDRLLLLLPALVAVRKQRLRVVLLAGARRRGGSSVAKPPHVGRLYCTDDELFPVELPTNERPKREGKEGVGGGTVSCATHIRCSRKGQCTDTGCLMQHVQAQSR